MNILISACLLGVNCRYDGTGALSDKVEKLMVRHNLIPVCPEVFGGLATPREPAEQLGNKVITRTGEDVTEYYERGAAEVLKLARLYGCRYAVLKERSPSCGYGRVYDGTFTKTLVDGNGKLAGLLAGEGLTVIGESRIDTLLT